METNSLANLKTLVSEFESDYLKFTEKGNKSAATRARKSLQEIRNLAKELRTEISETKKKMTA
jgi:hypothetical protein